MLINRQNLNIVFTGFKTVFQQAFEGAPTMYDKVAMTVPSTTAQEQYAWLKNTTGFREWLGDRVIQNLGAGDFTIKNKKFENTVGVPSDALDDDSYGLYKPLIAQLGQDAKTHPDELVFALLAAGFSGRCYDGQYFFDSDHPVLDVDGSTKSVSNYQSGSGAPWILVDNSRVIKPIIYQVRKPYNFVTKDDAKDDNVFFGGQIIYGVDARCNVGYGLWQLAYGSKADLTSTNYGLVRAGMLGMKGDKGKVLGVRPKLLLVGPSREGQALEVVKAERNADGATNVYRDTAEVVVVPWLE